MPVLQLVQDGIGEKLKLRLLHDKQHLFLQPLRRQRFAEQRNYPAGGLIKSCDELAERRFAAAVRADKPDDLVLPDRKTRAGERFALAFERQQEGF